MQQHGLDVFRVHALLEQAGGDKTQRYWRQMLHAHEAPGFVGFAMDHMIENSIRDAVQRRHGAFMESNGLVVDGQ